MKKVFLASLLLLSFGLYSAAAETQFGPTLVYNFAEVSRTFDDLDSLNLSDFSYGGDLRFTSSIFQLSFLGLYTPQNSGRGSTTSSLVELHANAGITLDLHLLRLSAGIGPSVDIILHDSDDRRTNFGSNARLSADLMFDGAAFSLYYLMDYDFSFYRLDRYFNGGLRNGYFGASVIFSL